jgi:hypothetical protein
MFKTKVNDESKETNCNYIVIFKFCNPSKKNWNKYLIFSSCFEIERSHKVQCDYDSKLIIPKSL